MQSVTLSSIKLEPLCPQNHSCCFPSMPVVNPDLAVHRRPTWGEAWWGVGGPVAPTFLMLRILQAEARQACFCYTSAAFNSWWLFVLLERNIPESISDLILHLLEGGRAGPGRAEPGQVRCCSCWGATRSAAAGSGLGWNGDEGFFFSL